MAKDAKLKNKDKGKKEAHTDARNASFNACNTEFDEMISYCKALQQKTKARQRIMAQLAMEAFSAISIQCAWRQSMARRKVYEYNRMRFITLWARYHFFYRRPRLRCGKYIKRFLLSRRIITLFRNITLIVKTGKKIIHWYRYKKAIETAKNNLIRFRIRNQIMKRCIVFGTTRAQNKLMRNRIQNENKANRRYQMAAKIIKFLRNIIFTRKLQLLHSQLFMYRLECLRVKGILDARDVFGEADPTYMGRYTDTMNSLAAGSVDSSPHASNDDDDHNSLSNINKRRGGVAPIKRLTVVSGKIAKNQPVGLQRQSEGSKVSGAAKHVYAHDLPALTAWSSHMAPFSEIILHILARIRPYHGRYHGEDRDTSSIFDYLVKKRYDYFHKQNKEIKEIRSGNPYKARTLIKDIKISQGLAGLVSTDSMLPVALTQHDRSTTTSKTTTTGTAAPGHRRAAVSSANGLAGLSSHTLNSPNHTNGSRRREASMINKSPREKLKEKQHLSRHEVPKDTQNKSDFEARLAKIDGGDGSLFELYKSSSSLPLPQEFSGIYRPKTIYEIIQLIYALRDMVIVMSDEAFHRILGKSGADAHEMQTDGTTTQDAIHNGKSVRLGIPDNEVLLNYFIFINTTPLQTTTVAHMQCLKQSRRIEKRANDLLRGSKDIVAGKKWTPLITNDLEEEQDTKMEWMKFYTKPGKNGTISGIYKLYFDSIYRKIRNLTKDEKILQLKAKAQKFASSEEDNDSDTEDNDVKIIPKQAKVINDNNDEFNLKRMQNKNGKISSLNSINEEDIMKKLTDEEIAITEAVHLAARNAPNYKVFDLESAAKAAHIAEEDVIMKKSKEKNTKSINPPSKAKNGKISAPGSKTSNIISQASIKNSKKPIKKATDNNIHKKGKNKNKDKNIPVLEVEPPAKITEKGGVIPTYTYANVAVEEGDNSRVVEVGINVATGDRHGGRTGHIQGHNIIPLVNDEQRIARDEAIQKLQNITANGLGEHASDYPRVKVPDIFTPDFSSTQYSSEFTKSLLLHMDNETSTNTIIVPLSDSSTAPINTCDIEKENQYSSNNLKLISRKVNNDSHDDDDNTSSMEIRAPEAPTGLPPRSSMSSLQQHRAVHFAMPDTNTTMSHHHSINSDSNFTKDVNESLHKASTSQDVGHGAWSERRRRNRNMH